MQSQVSLDESIRLKNDLIEAIKQKSRQKTWPILRAILITIILPYANFLVLWAVTNYAREYVAITFQDSSLNLMSLISSLLLMVAGTYRVWRWVERRFRGIALVGRLMGVAQAVLAVERQIDTVKGQAQATEQDVKEIERLAYAAWNQFVQSMREAGIPVDDER